MTKATQKAKARMAQLLVAEGITLSIQDTVDCPRWRDYNSLSTFKIIARRPAERGRPNRFVFYQPMQPGAQRPTAWDVMSEQGFELLQMLGVSSLDDYCEAKGISGIDQTPELRAQAERSFAADLVHARQMEDFFGDDGAIELMEIVETWISE